MSDFVFSDINQLQSSKIHAVSVSEFREVWWFYPSAGSTDINRYVVVNYDQGFWMGGNLERTAGVDAGAYDAPLMADASGTVYQHESGNTMLDPTGAALTPFIESGPQEIGAGDQLMVVRQIIPDELALGDVQATLFAAPYPTAAEAQSGPFTAAEPTPVRMSGREVRLKLEQVNPDWRIGEFRLDVVPGEGR